MEICIRKEKNNFVYIDKFALNRFSKEELAKSPYNYCFVNVEKDDCEAEDFDDNLIFNIEKYNTRKEKEKNITRVENLKSWFNNYFDKQLTQSLWQNDFKPSYDSFFAKEYFDIEELKEQAKIVREEIKILNTK